MTELLYYSDSYIRSFEAEVLQMETDSGLRAVLDKTAFYPGGGGQPFDTGWLVVDDERASVTRVKRQEGLVWHDIETDSSQKLTVGSFATGELDWERRYLTMRTHTALHILGAVVYNEYDASVTGGNMEPGRGRMDFEFETMRKELVEEIETRCNEEVAAARSISTKTLARAEALKIPDLIKTKVNLVPESVKEIRIVEIDGLDMQADGGTHVKNTEEVGKIQVVDYKSKGAINKRIYIELT
ncbi:MAG: alanyl-tRNA editing protein [Candidatus Thorarchaeota archaeon]